MKAIEEGTPAVIVNARIRELSERRSAIIAEIRGLETPEEGAAAECAIREHLERAREMLAGEWTAEERDRLREICRVTCDPETGRGKIELWLAKKDEVAISFLLPHTLTEGSDWSSVSRILQAEFSLAG